MSKVCWAQLPTQISAKKLISRRTLKRQCKTAPTESIDGSIRSLRSWYVPRAFLGKSYSSAKAVKLSWQMTPGMRSFGKAMKLGRRGF